MKPTLQQSVEDLLINESFLNYYFQKNESDIWEWEEFQEEFPQSIAIIEEAKGLLNALSLKWTEDEIRDKYNLIKLKPQFTLNNFFKNHGKKVVSIAASVLIVLSFYFYQQIASPSPIYKNLTETKVLIEKVNESKKPLLVVLSDGSSILLSQNARLSYPASFNTDKREVYLDGEAFFEVSKNPKKPFLVYANEIITKVIGTSFKITAIKGEKDIKVVVKTGKVSVYSSNELNKVAKEKVVSGVVITENQQIIFDKKEVNFTKTLVSEPELIDYAGVPNFDFKNSQVTNIFKTIQKAYGVNIIFDEELLKDCTLTADLNDEPLYEKLNLICLGIEAEYEIIDGQIIITSKGCK